MKAYVIVVIGLLVVGCGKGNQTAKESPQKTPTKEPTLEEKVKKKIMDENLMQLIRMEQEGKEFMDKILSSPSIVNVDESDFVGDYFYEMTLPENNKETGKIIVRKHNSIYYLQWTRDDGPVYTGIGIRKGNGLSVCYSYSLFREGERGVSIYWISDGKEISGEWTFLGDTAPDIQTDKWKRIK